MLENSHAKGNINFNRIVCPLQFDAVENGMHTSKMMQVFSKQAPMIDALISHFAEQMRRRKLGENGQPPENTAEGMLRLNSVKFVINSNC